MKIKCPVCEKQSIVCKEDVEKLFTNNVVFKAIKSNRYLIKTWCEKSQAKPVVAVLAKLIQEEPHLEEDIMKGTIPNACCKNAILAEIFEIKNNEKTEYDSDYYGYAWG